MNKVEEMLKELCPNGVEYKALGEVCEITKGQQLNKDILLKEGKYPVINGGINPSGYWQEYNCLENTITISQGGASAGYVNYIIRKFWAGAHCYVIKNCKDIINYKFLYYIIKNYEEILMTSQVGAGIPSVPQQQLAKIKIPIPPMAVQREIVKILDNFAELTAELTAELNARKKQYEFYRNKLLTFDTSDDTKKGGGITNL